MTKRTLPPPGGPRFMRLDEVAHELGYKSRWAVYKLISDKKLAAAPVGPAGSLRVTRAEFERYCAAAEAEGRARFGAA